MLSVGASNAFSTYIRRDDGFSCSHPFNDFNAHATSRQEGNHHDLLIGHKLNRRGHLTSHHNITGGITEVTWGEPFSREEKLHRRGLFDHQGPYLLQEPLNSFLVGPPVHG